MGFLDVAGPEVDVTSGGYGLWIAIGAVVLVAIIVLIIILGINKSKKEGKENEKDV